MKSRFIAIVLLVLLTISCLTAYAEESNTVPYASDLIFSYTTKLIPSGNSLTATSTLVTTEPVDQLGISTLKFQKYTNGSWVTVKTISSVYSFNLSTFQDTHSYTGISGEKYRAVCTFYVRNGTTSQSRTRTSGTVTL